MDSGAEEDLEAALEELAEMECLGAPPAPPLSAGELQEMEGELQEMDKMDELMAELADDSADGALAARTSELAAQARTFSRKSAGAARRNSNPLSRMVGSIARTFGGALAASAAPAASAPAAPHAAPTAPPPARGPTRPSAADEPWLKALEAGYRSGGLAGALAAFDTNDECRRRQREASPSTFIRASELLHQCGAPAAVCADMLFNVLEVRLPDFQTCRVVAYHLLSLERFDDAVRLLELVRAELAPAEPHSHTDVALAKLLRLRRAGATRPFDGDPTGARDSARAGREDAGAAGEEMRDIVSALAKVVTSTEIPERFREIEWPALILLSWAVAWAEHAFPALRGTLWPQEQLDAATYRVGGEAGPQLDVFVWLGWDTDHTDVDLHVKEPTGEEVNYSHNRSATTGARVSRDFTGGFGPEVYTLPKAPKGTYKVETNYYASHQASASTGATSAIIWSVQHMGRFEQEALQFSTVRLTAHKQRQQVLELVAE